MWLFGGVLWLGAVLLCLLAIVSAVWQYPPLGFVIVGCTWWAARRVRRMWAAAMHDTRLQR